MNIHKVKELLSEIEHLLRQYNQNQWANLLRRANILVDPDPIGGRSDILGLYGGMGSLTDLILYANGLPLVAENNRLQELREQLYCELY
jgi:hypothetical protein